MEPTFQKSEKKKLGPTLISLRLSNDALLLTLSFLFFAFGKLVNNNI